MFFVKNGKLSIGREFDNFGGARPIVNCDNCDAHGRTRATRTGASRINAQNPAEELDARQMRVPGNDDIRSRRHKIEIFRVPVMQENFRRSDFHDIKQRKRAALRRVIGISLNGGDGSNRFEFPQKRIGTNIAGVEDVIDIAKNVEDGGTQQTVRVGNYADFQRRAEVFHG